MFKQDSVKSADHWKGDQPFYRRHFLEFFRRRREARNLRPGAMREDALRKAINEIGKGKVAEITRIGFDGKVDEMPIAVEILDIHREGFSGKIINVEREIIEGSSSTVIYAKHGGGTLEFGFSDGDIKSVQESSDVPELEAARDVDAMLEILSALEPDDRILVAYYDRQRHGAVNVEGTLVSADPEIKSFRMLIEKINRVELENHIAREFDLVEDLVIDISMI